MAGRIIPGDGWNEKKIPKKGDSEVREGEKKCCTRRNDLFQRNYKQGADGSRNQDESTEKERKMKLLLNGTNHGGEVIRAIGNHYNDNMV